MHQIDHRVTPPERQSALQLTDGRRLAWPEWGPESGRPVLFCTGAGMSGWLGFGAAYRRSLEEGFSQGAQGYARDLVNTWGVWPFEPEDIDAPVDLWYGDRDTSPGHSPDFGKTLASRLRNVSHTLDPEEGGSILWRKSRDILAKLASHEAAY